MYEQQSDYEQYASDLDTAHDRVDDLGRAQSRHYYEIYDPYQSRPEKQGGPAVGEQRGNKRADCIVEHHSIGHVCEGGAEPVSPRGHEAGERTEALAGVQIHAGVEFRVAVREDLERGHEQKHSGRSDKP